VTRLFGSRPYPRAVSALTSVVVAGAGLFLVSPAAAYADSSPCADGSTPTLLSTVT
jgi:hypothetical protein